jgi:hypothetical protein
MSDDEARSTLSSGEEPRVSKKQLIMVAIESAVGCALGFLIYEYIFNHK